MNVKRIYTLPSLVTTGNFFSGIMSILLSLQGKFTKAASWIMIAMIFDFLDGQIARLVKGDSKFGEEYDSLSDLITFGIAPMVLMFEMALFKMERLGWSVAFIYSVSCALRLARYNARIDGSHKLFFSGLPSPAAGGLIASSVIAANHVKWLGIAQIAPFLMFMTAFLMISNIKYPSLYVFGLRKKGPFIYLAMSVVTLAGFILFREVCLVIGFTLYAIGGPIYDMFFKNTDIELTMERINDLGADSKL